MGGHVLDINIHTLSEEKSHVSKGVAASQRYKLMQIFFSFFGSWLTENDNPTDCCALPWMCGMQSDLDEILCTVARAERCVWVVCDSNGEKEHSKMW